MTTSNKLKDHCHSWTQTMQGASGYIVKVCASSLRRQIEHLPFDISQNHCGKICIEVVNP